MTPGGRGFAPIDEGQSLSYAFAMILEHNFMAILAWREAARIGEDIEGVHQMRVSFRRLRSALKVFRPVIPRAVTDPWSETMRGLVNQTGMARDLDVFIHEGLHEMEADLPKTGAQAMLDAAWQAREKAYEQVRAMLDSAAFRGFTRNFPAWYGTQAWLAGDGYGDKQRRRLLDPVIPGAQRLLDKREKAVMKAGSGIDQHDTQAMHQLRIACKGLRYTAEFFTPLFPEMPEFVSHLKGLQDVLGVMHDGAVTQDLVDHILEGHDDPKLLAYGEAVVGWRLDQMERIRQTFDPHWADFAATPCPWRMGNPAHESHG